MSFEELSRKAGFHVNGDVYSPVREELITDPLLEFLNLIEQELLMDLSQEREPGKLNYSTNAKYSEVVSRTMSKLRG